ncbi:MAG: U32 family peptidase [Anaerohalosphaera sp.]|nr:U32 family peptidase [Anaerohalosphaera sp.]
MVDGKAELLAPAGDLEKLKWACAYGADAVYFGYEFGSLRSFAGNFSLADAEAGIKYLHERGKKGYAALNIYPFSKEYDKVRETAGVLDEVGVDAFIVADIGVLNCLKRLGVRAAIHVSTQANTVSDAAAIAYADMGASRVNLARELSAEQICEIAKKTERRIETEVFVHGSVCFSYSGRCAISDYLTGYRANHGECKHPCRWKYALVEEKRPGEYMPVYEDERGLYFFNSKELALFEYVGRLTEAGVASFKIEGRMKAVHYLASVVSFYRQVLDGKKFSREEGMRLLGRVPNRGYSDGFMKGDVGPDDYSMGESLSQANSLFVGNITGEKYEGKSVVEVRNKICGDDELEVLKPDGTLTTITMPAEMMTTNGQSVDVVNNNKAITIDIDLPEFSVLRKVGTKDEKYRC